MKLMMRAGVALSILAIAFTGKTYAGSVNPPGGYNGGLTIANVLLDRSYRDLGRALPGETMRLVLALRYRNESELARLVQVQADRTSPEFNHYLTAVQFAARFAPAGNTTARLVAFFQRHGFSVSAVYPDRGVLELRGSVFAVEQTFKTRIDRVGWRDREVRLGNVTPVTLPKEISSDVAGITGINDVAGGQSQFRLGTPKEVPHIGVTVGRNVIGGPTMGPNGLGYGPALIASDFDFPAEYGYTGAGQLIGIITGDSYLPADYFSYVSYFQVKETGHVTLDNVNGGHSFNPADGDSREAELDLETITGLAPAANVNVYSLPPTGGGSSINDSDEVSAINFAIGDNVNVISISYGGCENDNIGFDNSIASLAAQASARGITIVASSGDDGYQGCDGRSYAGQTESPASQELVTAVGGLSPDTQTVGTLLYKASYAWCQSNPKECTGGGNSTHFGQPVWQNGLVIGNNRNVPDMALAADCNYPQAMFFNQSASYGCGTSWAAPTFSAAQAEINQAENSRHGSVNQALYGAYKTYRYGNYNPAMYYDITAGNNGFQAIPGYDYDSGIGQPDLYGLSRVNT